MAGCQDINSLWPSDAIRRQVTESTLAQVMACCLTASSHYLNQCWLVISYILYIFKMMLWTENVSTLCLVTLRFLRKGPIGHVTLVVITSTTILVPYLKVKPLQLIWRSGTGWFLLQAPNLKMRRRDFIIWQGARILTHCGLAMP